MEVQGIVAKSIFRRNLPRRPINFDNFENPSLRKKRDLKPIFLRADVGLLFVVIKKNSAHELYKCNNHIFRFKN